MEFFRKYIILFIALANVNWTFVCSERISCPEINSPNLRTRLRSKGRIVNFRCKNKFERVGVKFAVCLESGQWSQQIPTCVGTTCRRPEKVPNLIVEELYKGGVLKFTCGAGLIRSGPETLMCDGNKWNDQPPQCIEGTTLQCDFEEPGLCGWSNDFEDNFDWTWQQGATPTAQTGPRFDHTTNSSEGHYLYMESSAPQAFGQKTRILSPPYSPAFMINMCLEFFYHMSGPEGAGEVGELDVYLKPLTLKTAMLNQSQRIFHQSGNHGDQWLRADVQIPPMADTFQIVLQATRLKSWSADIAIDDVRLHNCVEETTTSSGPADTDDNDEEDNVQESPEQKTTARRSTASTDSTTKLPTTATTPSTPKRTVTTTDAISTSRSTGTATTTTPTKSTKSLITPTFKATASTSRSTTTPTTISPKPTTASSQPTTTSAKPTTSSQPTTTSAKPTTTSAKPTTSTTPTTSSTTPTTTSTTPTTTSTRPTTTTVKLTRPTTVTETTATSTTVSTKTTATTTAATTSTTSTTATAKATSEPATNPTSTVPDEVSTDTVDSVSTDALSSTQSSMDRNNWSTTKDHITMNVASFTTDADDSDDHTRSDNNNGDFDNDYDTDIPVTPVDEDNEDTASTPAPDDIDYDSTNDVTFEPTSMFNISAGDNGSLPSASDKEDGRNESYESTTLSQRETENILRNGDPNHGEVREKGGHSSSNTTEMLPLIVGVATSVIVAAVVIAILAYLWARNQRRKDDKEQEDQMNIITEYVETNLSI